MLGQRLTAMITPSGGEKPIGGLPVALASGIIGVVRSRVEGYTVIVSRGTDREQVRYKVLNGLPPDASGQLTVTGSPVSAADLAEAWSRVQQRSWVERGSSHTYAVDLDPGSQRVVVDLYETDSDVAASERESLLAINPQLVTVNVSDQPASRASRTNDNSPHYGGANIVGPAWICTAGFSVTFSANGTDQGVTAGHCGSNGDSFSSGSHFFGDLAGKSGFPTYDQARLTGSDYTAGLYTDGGDSYSIRTPHNANDGAIGDLVCLSGAATLSVCNVEIKSLTASYCDSAGCTTYLMRGKKDSDTIIVQEGDSGGPVYHRNLTSGRASLRGMIIAFDRGGVRVYAERYNSIAGHLGVLAELI